MFYTEKYFSRRGPNWRVKSVIQYWIEIMWLLYASWVSKIFLREVFTNLFTLSTRPLLAYGAATATRWWTMLRFLTNNANSCEMNAVPRSVIKVLGAATVWNKVGKHFIVSLEVVDLTGKSHVKRENASIITKICLNPSMDSEIRPMWSTCIILKGNLGDSVNCISPHGNLRNS